MADVTYDVQGFSTLTGTWSPLARKAGTAAGSWLGGGTTRLTQGSIVGGRQPVEVGRPTSTNGQPRYFLRLQVTIP